jgi:hypothetical protein
VDPGYRNWSRAGEISAERALDRPEADHVCEEASRKVATGLLHEDSARRVRAARGALPIDLEHGIAAVAAGSLERSSDDAERSQIEIMRTSAPAEQPLEGPGIRQLVRREWEGAAQGRCGGVESDGDQGVAELPPEREPILERNDSPPASVPLDGGEPQAVGPPGLAAGTVRL